MSGCLKVRLHTITVSDDDGCGLLSLSLSVCSYYVAAGENHKAKAWERIWRQLLLYHLSASTQILFVSTAQIGELGGTMFEFKSILQLLLRWCVNETKLGLYLKVGPNHNSTTVVVVCKCTFKR